MKLLDSSNFFSGIPVRQLLSAIDYRPLSRDTQIATSLCLPTDESILAARSQSHLTNATPKDDQIRFPLRDRVIRSIHKLVEEVTQQLPLAPAQITVRLAADDFVSIEFFAALGAVYEVSNQLAEPTELLTAQELQLVEFTRQSGCDHELLIRKSQERVHATDYRTAYRLLSIIAEEDRTNQAHYILGLCTNFFGRTEESERHFRKMLASHDPLSRVKSSYVLSMLYLRMHEHSKQDLKTAEDLLETAYSELLAYPEIEDGTFHRVFNRNGFALCLFRRGKIVEALEMLEDGIRKLKESDQGARKLHQSVLIYNSVQCLRALGRLDECEHKCAELLAIDPRFPEYHLEHARVLLESNKVDTALRSIDTAIRLDAHIPEAHAFRGYALLQNGNLNEAAASYRRASELNPKNLQHKLDLEYCLSELEGAS